MVFVVAYTYIRSNVRGIKIMSDIVDEPGLEQH